MKITKIKIENFKSIKEMEFEIKKYGDSYTTMLLGINESGKSNILQAMSYLQTPTKEFNYLDIRNQKDDSNNPVDLWFHLSPTNKSISLSEIQKKVIVGKELLSFEIDEIVKNVYLQHEEVNFIDSIDFKVKRLTKGLFIKKVQKNITQTNGQVIAVDRFEIVNKKDEEGGYSELNMDTFLDLFKELIEDVIRKFEPKVSFWEPSDKFLISEEDLNDFSEDIDSNISLKNIFTLAGFSTEEEIQGSIKNISNGQQRSKLISKITKALNEYLNEVWNNDIQIVIDITETGKFTLSIRDAGEENEHDRLPISGRSEGARHFLSLILSLSIENKNKKRANQLILIDEPEAHLHPSGIRDLRKELLKIGQKNFLFASTHSPYLVDKQNRSRNIIIKKDSSAITNKVIIDKHTSIVDDEVLREAFGIEVYKDLLNPHSILVEGASDKIILQKALTAKKLNEYSITNGHGSNIVSLAAKLNDTDISLLVVVDDDKDGKNDKLNIIKIGGSYSKKNVFTIRDLVGGVKDGGTIEDMLGKEFIESQFKKYYEKYFNVKKCDISLDDSIFLNQIKKYLNENDRAVDKDFLDGFKSEISENIKLTEKKLTEDFSLLNSLVEEIKKNLS